MGSSKNPNKSWILSESWYVAGPCEKKQDTQYVSNAVSAQRNVRIDIHKQWTEEKWMVAAFKNSS